MSLDQNAFGTEPMVSIHTLISKLCLVEIYSVRERRPRNQCAIAQMQSLQTTNVIVTTQQFSEILVKCPGMIRDTVSILSIAISA